MKIRSLLPSILSLLLAGTAAHAQTNETWTGSSSSVWDTVTTNWDQGLGADTWVNGNDAIFGATGAGTVTIASGGVSANSLTFNATSYNIGGDPLTLTGAASITSNANATISSAIAGNQGLTTLGSGTLTLTNANTYTGTTTVSAGQLVLQNTNASNAYSIASGASAEFNVAAGTLDLPTATFSGTGTLVKSGAGTLIWSGDAATFAMDAGSLIDVQGGEFIGGSHANEDWTNNHSSLNIASGATFSGVEAQVRIDALTGSGTYRAGSFGGTTTIGVANGSGTFAGIMEDDQYGSGGLNLTKVGTGTQTLTGANTYTGSTTINGGRLVLQNSNVSPSYSIASGAALEFNAASGTMDQATATFSGTGTLIKSGAGALIWSGSVATFAMSAGSLIDVQGGEFIGGSNANEDWTNNHSSLNIASGATFSGVEAQVRIDALTGSGTYRAGSFGGTTTIGVANGSGTFAGIMEDDQYGSGGLNLTKVGTGTQTLTGANTYTGSTTINGGRLVLQNSNVSPSYSIASGAALEFNAASGTMDQATATFSGTGTLIKSGAGALIWSGSVATFAMSAGSLIDVQGGEFIGGSNANEDWTNNHSSLNIASGATFSGVEAQVRIDALTGSGTYRAGSFGGTTTIGVANGSGTFAGIMQDDQYGSGGLNLTKVGTGTQTLTGANTYTGTTTIAGGILSAENDKALGDTSGVVVNGGTLDIRGTTAGTLTIGDGGSFTLTSGTINLQLGTTFDQLVSSSGGFFNITGGSLALDVTGIGFSYGHSYQVFSGFGGTNTVAGLTITGYDTADWLSSLDNTGLLSFTAVPEPSTSWALLLAGGAVMLRMFRRRHS